MLDIIEFKKAMLSEKDVLCLEFDFDQNLPLPKIPVSNQFYRRFIRLHIFDVQVFGKHNKNDSIVSILSLLSKKLQIRVQIKIQTQKIAYNCKGF